MHFNMNVQEGPIKISVLYTLYVHSTTDVRQVIKSVIVILPSCVFCFHTKLQPLSYRISAGLTWLV